MLDRFFKATCNKFSAGHPSRLEPAQASIVLPAISIDSAAMYASPASCLDEIFSDIISEQPKFGMRV